MLGDLSFVQFLSGYARSRKHNLEGSRVLTLSGNGIGELEKIYMSAVEAQSPGNIDGHASSDGIMRFLMETSQDEVRKFSNGRKIT